MDAAGQVGVFERALDAARRAASDDDYDQVWSMLAAIADEGPDAIRPALIHLSSDEAVVRATACDLVGIICERYEEARKRAVEHLLELVAAESNSDVRWSAARALGATASVRAIPALLALAPDPNEDVRRQVAVALPACSVEHVEPEVVKALIELTRDGDAEVRNWASFGLGRQLDFDSAALRDALWERVTDESQDVREEAIAGLSRRRDARALPLVVHLLASGDVPSWLFDAAASLADAALVPACASTTRPTSSSGARSRGVTRSAEPRVSARSRHSSTKRSDCSTSDRPAPSLRRGAAFWTSMCSCVFGWTIANGTARLVTSWRRRATTR